MTVNMLPISARRLCRRKLQLKDGAIKRAALFPMFDRQGRIKRIMVLSSGLPDIFLIKPRAGMFQIPIWGSIFLADHVACLQRISRDHFNAIRKLWHYDPYWMLNDESYAGQRVIRLLKVTNCADRLPDNIRMVYFKRDLSQVNYVLIRDDNKLSLPVWDSSYLPEPLAETPVEAPGQAAVKWCLDPVWRQWTVQ